MDRVTSTRWSQEELDDAVLEALGPHGPRGGPPGGPGAGSGPASLDPGSEKQREVGLEALGDLWRGPDPSGSGGGAESQLPYPEAKRQGALRCVLETLERHPVPLEPELEAWPDWKREQGALERRVVAAAFRSTSVPSLHRRAERLRDCGLEERWCTVVDEPEATYRYRVRCRDRMCPDCRVLRAGLWREKLLPVVRQAWRAGQVVRFLTVTQRGRAGEWPADALARMMGTFSALRRTVSWKTHCLGWARFTELTRTGSTWHAHLHILFVGKYWKQSDIAALLRSIQGDDGAGVCDIRAAYGGALEELVKYPLKPQSLANMTEKDVVRCALALRGHRLVSLGGAWARSWPKRAAARAGRLLEATAAILERAWAPAGEAARAALDSWGRSALEWLELQWWRACYRVELVDRAPP